MTNLKNSCQEQNMLVIFTNYNYCLELKYSFVSSLSFFVLTDKPWNDHCGIYYNLWIKLMSYSRVLQDACLTSIFYTFYLFLKFGYCQLIIIHKYSIDYKEWKKYMINLMINSC